MCIKQSQQAGVLGLGQGKSRDSECAEVMWCGRHFFPSTWEMPLWLKGEFFALFRGALSRLTAWFGARVLLWKDITGIPFWDTSERVAYCSHCTQELNRLFIVFPFDTFLSFLALGSDRMFDGDVLRRRRDFGKVVSVFQEGAPVYQVPGKRQCPPSHIMPSAKAAQVSSPASGAN